jgi:antitoxin YefM
MDSISYTEVRKNLAKVMDQVCNDYAPVVITRKGKASVVVMSLEEY